MPEAPRNEHVQPLRLALHRLDFTQFAALARGDGGYAEVAELAASQRSKRRLQLCTVVQHALARGGEVAVEARRSFGLLCAAESITPEAVRAVLAHPYLDNWASTCLRQLGEEPQAIESGQNLVTIGYLTSLSTAAAARAGLSFELSLPSVGDVVIPTLGTAHGLGDGFVKVVGEPGRLTFDGPTGTVVVTCPFEVTSPGWAPIRTMRFGAGQNEYLLAIEDQDPYRDCYQRQPAIRLTGAFGDQLESLCRQAWSLIAADYPEHAEGMRAALRSLMPLAPSDDGVSQGATSFRAFGSLAISASSDPDSLALSLIHEFQHMKLVAIIDLVDLYEPGGQPCHFAPWRADPRPVHALLHGAYAHVGVCDFWRRRRARLADPASLRAAHFEFALWRRLTLQAVESLLRSDELTALGVKFVVPLRDRLLEWGADPVPEHVNRAAEDASLAYVVRWRIVNKTPPARLEGLISAPRPDWLPARTDLATLLSEAEPAVVPPSALGTAEPVFAARIRSSLTGQSTSAMPALPDDSAGPALREADAAYLEGKLDDAARAYATAIESGEPEGWVGLAIVLSRRSGKSTALVESPHLALRLHLAGRGLAHPAEVANWLAALPATGDRPPVGTRSTC